MTAAVAAPADVLAFWRTAGPDKWFTKDDTFDASIRDKFLATYEAAAAGKLSAWEETADGALALVITLDQFPRNMFRGQARIYFADPVARAVTRRAIARGFDKGLPNTDRHFFYLPFEHSEDLSDQERACALCESMGDPEITKWAEHHRDIVRRFGRFPHRNALFGRISTPQEQEFLDGGGFKG